MKHRHILGALGALIVLISTLTGCGGPSAHAKAQDRAARTHAIQQARQEMFVADLKANLVALGPVFVPVDAKQAKNMTGVGYGLCARLEAGVAPRDLAEKMASLGVTYEQAANMLTLTSQDLCPDQQMRVSYAFGG